MAAFHVHRVYWVAHLDVIVLSGRPESGLPRPGGSIDLPREVAGPGWVPIRDVQNIAFQDGKERTCVILDYAVVEGSPLMEFKDLEGKALETR